MSSWPAAAENLYDGCDNSSPHPYCKDEAATGWTDNFRNFPLHAVVRFFHALQKPDAVPY